MRSASACAYVAAQDGVPRGDEVRALRELCRQFPDSAFVFTTERGGAFTADAINRHVKRIGWRAGLPAVHAHMLRHVDCVGLTLLGELAKHDPRLPDRLPVVFRRGAGIAAR